MIQARQHRSANAMARAFDSPLYLEEKSSKLASNIAADCHRSPRIVCQSYDDPLLLGPSISTA